MWIPKTMTRTVVAAFAACLIELFDSKDQPEREYLKIILHRIYGKSMLHRPFIRTAINNVLYGFILETQRHNGIAELLEILGSIINGFALPMKEKHKLFLIGTLIPLHKPKTFSSYHQQGNNSLIASFSRLDAALTFLSFRLLNEHLWNNEQIISIVAQNRNFILPVIFEALENNMKSHWNRAVHWLTANVRKMFLEMDAELFEECQRQYLEKEARA
ncbi:Serine/threonine protein phosphatase 2A 59 kDa regulatory subunit B' gamma isoform [Glycine soja]|uniref:Serine/threonine protein phosphatase 2A 59 kDa regulatory subunit B' gamma isoform n=1 Tax=Glycine soja TaxID=3848 RepID=A0A445F3H3_GLYSO|nr:Serine/threonine protein phosphatase 2A 59 kDa regulatory subunit B' gamma isoform [Glycine soja]